MEVALTRMSSKGQIVIPAKLRKDILEGEKFLVFRKDDQFIMKKASKLDQNLAEDMEFAKRTEEAWKSYQRGEFKSRDSKDFLKELEKW